MNDQKEPPINKPKAMGWKRMFTTIGYSTLGFKAAWKYEESFRQQFFVFLLGLPLSFFLARSWVECVLLLGSLVLILIVELLNSALETIVDRISTDFHELSGRAKDLGSAAAMLIMVMASFIWGTLLIMRLLGH
ncbi:MAG: diacylglycerol kinase [Saezia sp.]